MRVILAGGGTGGHIFPGIAVAEELKLQDAASEPLFVVNRDWEGLDAITYYGFPYRTVTAGKWNPRSLLKWVSTGFQLAVGFFESLLVIRNFKPDVVAGLGGYASVPLVLAGIVCGKKSVIQEQNYIPGLANKFLSRFVNEIEVSFPETKKFLKFSNVYVTGNPVRKSILTGSRLRGVESLGLEKDKLNLVIFGGSHGAHKMNMAVSEVLREFQEDSALVAAWQVIHITGRRDYPAIVRKYGSLPVRTYVFPFIEGMENVYNAADLIVCRAGGGTIAEVVAKGIPAVYVPYPWARDNHQEFNARWVCERGGGVLVKDGEVESKLEKVVVDLMKNREKREKMAAGSMKLGRPEAARKVAERMLALGVGLPTRFMCGEV